MRSKQLPGLPVLCLESGNQAGRVKRAVVDPKRKQVVALLVAKALSKKPLLPMTAVHALGTHAVTIASERDLCTLEDAGDIAPLLKAERVRVVGAPIVTVRGRLLGSVQDFDVDDAGKILGLYVSQSMWKSLSGKEASIPGRMVVALGKDAVIVADEAMDEVALPQSEQDKETPRPRVAKADPNRQRDAAESV